MAQAWHLKSRPTGAPGPQNFELKPIHLPELADGQIRVRNLWLSVDPYMRPRMDDVRNSYIPPYEVGAPLDGRAIGEVVQSRSSLFAPGDLVKHMMGWRDEAVLSPDQATRIRPLPGVPVEAYLGVLGATGATAYFGLFDVAGASDGDVVFVSAAAGAVGSMVIQLAKARGLVVIGSAGGPAKCAWVRELGADEVIDYKTPGRIQDKLRSAAPNGIDVYFDNVGGDHLDAALASANQRARFALCGMIEGYNHDVAPASFPHLMQAVKCRINMRGYISSDFLPRQAEFEEHVGHLISAGKVRPHSTVLHGVESMPDGFLGLFKGENVGKMLVKL